VFVTVALRLTARQTAAFDEFCAQRNKAVIERIRCFWSNESGATAIEYALLASLIAVALVPALGNLSKRLSSEFGEISGVFK
jgi:pilus assembly protein Flp/PilA